MFPFRPVFSVLFTLALLGCAALTGVEPTDVSVVEKGVTQSTVEAKLGKPTDTLVTDYGYVASYPYNLGFSDTVYLGQGVVLLPFLVPYLIKESERVTQYQRRQMAVVFDANQNLLFAGVLFQALGLASLADVAEQYAAAQSGDLEASYNLSKIALIPQQKINLLETAATGGNLEAQYELGNAYAYAEGVERDSSKAENWWRNAAGGGYVQAQLKLAENYSSGKGVTANLDEAEYWARKAADQGHSVGLANLAEIHRFGRGTEKDLKRAIKLYERAADSGHAQSAIAIGLLQERGDELPENKVAAYKWYIIAERADPEGPAAKFRKKYLADRLNPEQISEGERLAREWFDAQPK